jgi:hypothetical protein
MREQTELTPILEEKKAFHTCHVTSALAHRLKLEHHEACAKKIKHPCGYDSKPLRRGNCGRKPAKLLILNNLQKAGEGLAREEPKRWWAL